MSIQTRSHVENISPRKAQSWLEDNYERNRPVRKKRVAFYVEEMKKGRWRPTNPIAFAYLNGDRYLVNGQHTLSAIVESGVTVSYNPIHYHDVEDEGDINDLYAHYDIGKSRTYSDSLGAYDIVRQTGLTKTAIDHISSAVRFIIGGFSRTRPLIANEDLISLVMARVDDYKLFEEATTPCDLLIRNRLRSQGVLSVVLITMEYQKKRALEFWSQVSQLDGLRRRDPRLALHKTLITMTAYGGDGTTAGFHTEAFSHVAAYGWNKWYNGHELSLVKPTMASSVATKGGKIVIDGTPYDGKNNPT